MHFSLNLNKIEIKFDQTIIKGDLTRSIKDGSYLSRDTIWFKYWVMRQIVRVQYFVRGGFVGHRSRANSKHLYSHLPVDGVRFLGGQKGLRCSCKMHVWMSGSPKISTAAVSGYVTVP
ncbi:hypothetical protein TNCV_1864351 [Trichonephila clavipes]|nr:hypothetical protein TNCV_1864351 [Trichonephila clavipes]